MMRAEAGLDMNRKGTRAGFTLVEMLVVIAITMLLMGLILGPVIQSFNLTRRANAMIASQDTARTTLERISRELGQAMFVYDNSNSPINFPVQHPDMTRGVLEGLYGKVDMILPKLVMHCNNPDHPDGEPRDYERGDDAWPPCPVCESTDVEARPKEPLTPDKTVVRYFVGLADPNPVANGPDAYPEPGYMDWPESGSPMNGFILYRAEFDPYDENLLDFNRDGVIEPSEMDNPNFFYDDTIASDGNPFWKNWKKVAKPVGPQTDVNLVVLRLNEAKNHIDSLLPSVRFQLTQMTNDSFAPAYMTDEAAETPTAIPTVFRASYGGWGSSLGTSTPDIFNVTMSRYNPATQLNDVWFRTIWELSGDLMLYKYVNSGGVWVTTPIFNITNYLNTGTFAPMAKPDVAFIVDPVRGEVKFDFPASDQIHQDDIFAMNKNAFDNVESNTAAPFRAYVLSMFSGAGGNPESQPRIVPGSEVVRGPDMTPGLAPDDIRLVRYERVPLSLGDPGRNQYKIDYGLNPSTADQVGTIIFSPAFDEMIPEIMSGGAAHIDISYKFQLNRDGDIITGNYATKTLMTVTLGIRYYDRNSGKLHPVELTNKVRVRNLMR